MGGDGGRWCGGACLRGGAGSVSPATTEATGGVASRLEGAIKDLAIYLRHAFDLCVLGELCASRFPGPKRVRAKDAKDAKVRKGIAEMFLCLMGILTTNGHEFCTNGEGSWNGRGWREVVRGGLFAGGGGLSEPGYNGGDWRGGVSAGGGDKGPGHLSASCL